VVEGYSQKREELAILHQQSETSLVILDTMSGVLADSVDISCARICVCLSECVQLIMEDAKKKKRNWQQKLHDMKLKNLLQLRDSLMAAGSIHMMIVDYCVEDADQVTLCTLLTSLSIYPTCYILYLFLDYHYT